MHDRTASILLVNRHLEYLPPLQKSISKFGISCISAPDRAQALDLIGRVNPDVLMTDLVSDEPDYLDALYELPRKAPHVSIIVMSEQTSVRENVSQMNGSVDFLKLPFSQKQFEKAIQRALIKREKKYGTDNGVLKSQEFSGIVAKSPKMLAILKKVEKICRADANVMIYGESGTGKELIARTIHRQSSRKDEAFIPVDCVALPETLLESELFGYEKGAFTGAQSVRRGLLEYADRGVLFLDEIGELAPNLQAKLLRVLQEQEFRRVGGKSLKRVDIRVISATNLDPQQALQASTLREDLYYRLNVIPLFLPPLRERKEDIPIFVEHFLDHFANSFKYRRLGIEERAMQSLLEYQWPGNIRELRNLVECLVSLVDGEVIRFSDLPDYVSKQTAQISGDDKVNRLDFSSLIRLPFQMAKNELVVDFEKAYFSKLLLSSHGNISEAARSAEVSRRTLYRMIDIHGLQKLV